MSWTYSRPDSCSPSAAKASRIGAQRNACPSMLSRNSGYARVKHFEGHRCFVCDMTAKAGLHASLNGLRVLCLVMPLPSLLASGYADTARWTSRSSSFCAMWCPRNRQESEIHTLPKLIENDLEGKVRVHKGIGPRLSLASLMLFVVG